MITKLDQIVEAAVARGRKRLAVAFGQDSHTIEAVYNAWKEGLVEATLFGDKATIEKVCAVFRAQNLIPCTDCRYCMECCPMNIPIPALFACLNGRRAFKNWNTDYYYETYFHNILI